MTEPTDAGRGATAPPAGDPRAAIDAVFRIEFARLVAALTRRVGDLGLAEELAQDALVEALGSWPRAGIPHNPGGWLMAVAKRRAIDRFRRDSTLATLYSRLGESTGATIPAPEDAIEAADDEAISDDRLRLIFVACHPVVPLTSRVALTLRVVGGLTTTEIARAFLLPEPTVAQRIVRAKRAIAAANVEFEVPDGDDRHERLSAVLQVVYLIYNEGYSASSGSDWLRPELCAEAVRLGRLLAALAPDEPEVHGLLALMELQSSRLEARTAPDGSPILLADQDRRRWDRLLITRGLGSLARAEQLADGRGPYTLQAAIAACHARPARAADVDWASMAGLYQELATLTGSPVVELNRAVAVAMAGEPSIALEIVDALGDAGVLDGYHLFHSVRGDLLERLGRAAEAADEFHAAAALAGNARDQQLLAARATALHPGSDPR